MKNEGNSEEDLVTELRELRSAVSTYRKMEQEYQLAANELREYKKKYSTLFNKANDAIVVVALEPNGINGRIVEVNEVACEKLGYTRQEFLSLGPQDIFTEESLAVIPESIANCLSEGQVTLNLNQVTKEGKEIPVTVTSYHFCLNGENYLLSLAHECSGEKHFKEALRESELKFKTYVEQSPDAIFVADRTGKYVEVNPAACSLLGYSEEELLKLSVAQITTSKGLAHFNKLIEHGKRNGEAELIKKNGASVETDIRAVNLENGRYLAFVRDISDRKAAEEALRMSEERFSTVFRANPGAVAIISGRGRYLDVNDSFLRLTGFSREELIGKNVLKIGFLKGDEYQRILRTFKETGSISNAEVQFYRKTGELRLGLVAFEIITIAGKQCILVLMLDISEKKQLEKEIVNLERLHLIGEMAASIGHEIRNPMTAVRGFLQILQNKSDQIGYNEYYKIMIEELDRANSIITEFLLLAKNKALNLSSVNINAPVRAVSELIKAEALIEEKCLQLNLGDVSELPLDEKEIRQLILNLAFNGLEAMSPGGNLLIRTYAENGEVFLVVQDEGKGIDSSIIDKLGTPFLTTKDCGTGLGLAVCYNIAARHNAAIDVETGNGGTRFTVRFKQVPC